MRKWGMLLIAAALVAAPTAAHAGQDDNYTPVDPSQATLAGSVVTGDCRGGESWLDFVVSVTDPDDVAAETGDVTLVIEQSGRSVTVPLGALSDGSVAGSVPWPAAADTMLTRLPGGGTAATTVDGTIQVQPGSVPPLQYPITVPACGAQEKSAIAALAATGSSGWTPALGLAGGALIAIGSLLAVLRLRRSR
ncbi:hypothetical protein [Microbacterium sp.]|uniref:hypothetical protein n=1 Tax=Microbacterium sp. TaxID=51671 RepID=UPI002E380D58|nr:hypothetical protein [Microbacterium sp.]HEX5730899.1 hypothetical protein [Microbacterium sp.]